MKFKKTLLLLAVSSVLIVAGCNTDNSSAKLESITQSGLLAAVNETTYDWGEISIEGGNPEHQFQFKNNGEKDLILKGALTSCMCTTANFELPDGSLSPTFGMHNNKKWAYAVKPGQSFKMNVIYDPLAHGPDGVGLVRRSIFMLSSSEIDNQFTLPDQNSGNAITKIDVEAQVLYDKKYKEKYAADDFVFEEMEHDFGTLKQSGGLVSYDFKFKYLGSTPVKITGVPASCACTSAEISQKEFKSGDEGVLTVTFDPNLHEEPEGRFFKTVSVLTDPPLKEQPELKVWTEIDLDLGPQAYKLKEDHED